MWKTVGGLAVICSVMVAAGRSAPAGVTINGDTITFSFPASDQDLAVLDTQPDVTNIRFGGFEVWSGPGPIPPFAVTDAGFAHIANCKKLKKLQLSSMHPLQITDAGTAHLSGLLNLEELWLDFNKRVGDGTMQTVSNLKKLRVLRFYGAPITDAGVAKIAGLTELEDLQLGLAPVGDVALETICTFTKLKTLDLQHARVTDVGVLRLKPLQLTWLCLNGTRVTGAGIAALADMTNMDCLFLAGTGGG